MLEFQNILKIFAKGYIPNWSEENIKNRIKLKIQFIGLMLLVI